MGSWGPGILNSLFFLLSLPCSGSTQEKSVQGQGQPPGSGGDSIPPRTGKGDGGGVEATPHPQGRRVRMQQRQHNDGEEERTEKVESQVKRPRSHPGAPWAGSSLQLARCWESPSPVPVQRQKLECEKSGSLICRCSCPSTTRPALGSPQPLCLSPMGQERAALPATSVCPGHLKGACDMSPLVPEAGGGGVEGWGESGHLSPGW